MIKRDLGLLTLQEKVGQLFMFGFDALDVDSHAIELIKKHKVGNVILFARNVKTPEQLFKLNQNLQKLAFEEIGIPLLISIDQEGGMVTRIRNGGTFFPGAMTLTATNDSSNAYISGKLMGEELISLGINMNLAPVMDVNNNPYNPVIGVRSFGDDPKKVTEYGMKFVHGMQENVIATVKHFPGHGDTKVDSHLALPKIDYPLEHMESVELYPFKKAIKEGIKAIMSSHINFPAFTENGLPTTLSKKCLTGLLREKLGFEGLIITDGMQMKAIEHTYGTVKASLMAIEAGVNLVCICHSRELQVEAAEYVLKAVQNNELSEAIIDERLQRVLTYKKQLIVDLKKDYKDVKHIVENDITKAFMYDVVKKGVTLAKGDNYELNDKTLLIASDPVPTSIADEDSGSYSILQSVSKHLPMIDTFEVGIKPTKEDYQNVGKILDKYDTIIFCSYNSNVHVEQIEFMTYLKDAKDLYVMSMRNPYDLFFLPSLENVVNFYEYTPNSIKALISYLKGYLIPRGVLPIEL